MFNELYDTFISYRRDRGEEYAPIVYKFLIDKKYKPFFDRVCMDVGRFDEQLQHNVVNAKNFIFLFTKGALDRTLDENDWVREEIRLAIKHNINIIILKEKEADIPTNLPESIAKFINYQMIEFDGMKDLSNALEKIECKLLKKTEVGFFDPRDGEKISIAGEYITEYDDDSDGRIVTRKAPATLRVLFNHIYGKTYFGSKQVWRISGSINRKKQIFGKYWSTVDTDSGTGTMYLEPVSPSILNGYYCGYDNTNKQIFSGKYTFRKIYKNFKVTKLTSAHFPSIIEMADKQLGKNYITEEILKDALDETTPLRAVVAIDNKDDRVIGFCVYKAIGQEEIRAIIRNDKGIHEFNHMNKIGYLKTVVIDDRYQGYGIASDLVKRCVDILKQEGIQGFISTAWKHLGIINIASVLTRNGFKNKIEIADYWYEDSVKENFSCPQCGNPCHCSCVIYIKY